MGELQICMLGSFQVCRDFVPVPASVWKSPWSAKLLKLVLVMRPATVRAQDAVRQIGGMREADLAPALENASRALAPEAALTLGPDGHIRFEPGPRCWIDLDAMQAHYQAGVSSAARGDMFPAVMALQEADALYQGDLLEELQEAWVMPLRHRLQERYTEILERLAEGYAVLARYQDAVGFCHKALAHDPQRESAYQRMMVYYYYLGDLDGAAEAYRACQEAMEHAGRQVSAETGELWNRLCRAELHPAPGSSAAAGKESQ